MDQNETWHSGSLGPGHIVLDGTQLTPPPKGAGAQPPILAHVRFSQTAGWIKIPLGTEVGLGPRDIVLDGNPAPLPKKRGTAAPSKFSAHLL